MFFNIFKKNQVIKFEQNLCNANVYDNNVLFVRVNDIVKSKKALVEVPYTHKAFLIKGGIIGGLLGGGTYSVFDNVQEIAEWKKGVSVEVVYMPAETTNFQINWRTPRKLEYKDNVSKKVISVGAAGTFEICIEDYDKFFRKAIGFEKEFDKEKFSRRMQNYVVDEFINVFIAEVKRLKITCDEFDENRQAIAQRVGARLNNKIENEYGVHIKDFIITHFDKDFIITHFDLETMFKKMIDDVEENKKREDEKLKLEDKLEKEKLEKDAKIKEYLKRLECLGGDRYIGELKNDKRHGKGIFYWANGDTYEGDWVENKRHGKGICYYANGNKYEGDWVEDQKHGEGIYYFADGTTKKGVWENGVFIKE